MTAREPAYSERGRRLAPACPVCNTEAGRSFFDLCQVPVFCNVLWDSEARAANAAKGDVKLVCCEGCGLIYNSVFDASKVEYAPNYENALHFSGAFQTFAAQLANGLVERHNLSRKTVAEIGCGDGYFLQQIVAAGAYSGVGFDPSMDLNDKRSFVDDGITIIPEAFQSGNLPTHFDLVICRHVLEHLRDPLSLLDGIREAIGGRQSVLYFEVPNATWILESGSLWDFIYEHYTYWTASTLETLFAKAGFHQNETSTGFGNQFLMIEALTGGHESASFCEEGDIEAQIAICQQFGETAKRHLDRWEDQLATLFDSGRKVAIWGAGSKGVTFVNAVPAAREAIACLVDVNPRKQGKFVSGSAHPILAREHLVDLQPDLVIVPNAHYKREIGEDLLRMGIDAELQTLQ